MELSLSTSVGYSLITDKRPAYILDTSSELVFIMITNTAEGCASAANTSTSSMPR